MTDDHKPTPHDFGNPFADLEQSYALGNRAALYEAVTRSNAIGRGLPNWAVIPLQELVVEKWEPRLKEWKGSWTPNGMHYKALISHHIRAAVFRSVERWIENKHHFKGMPTRCIQAWYDGKLDYDPKGKEGAIAITQMGLLDTIASNISDETLDKHRYFGADKVADNLEVDDAEMAEAMEMSPDEYQSYISASYRDHRRLPLSFGYSDIEVIFGLRAAGQFWGPPCEPPDHIKAILEVEPFPSDDK